jgi:hypothetical protein
MPNKDIHKRSVSLLAQVPHLLVAPVYIGPANQGIRFEKPLSRFPLALTEVKAAQKGSAKQESGVSSGVSWFPYLVHFYAE